MPTVLILGGTSTIARAIAGELAARGFDLALGGRDLAELEAVAADLRVRHGVATTVHRMDVLEMEHHATTLKACLTPELRGAVLAFGYLGDQRRAESDAAEARRILDTNLTGSVLALDVVAAHLARGGGGFICALSSVAGERGRQSNYVYGAAKAGLTAYLSGLRGRLAPAGVQVLTVKAGIVDTRMSAGMPGAALAAPPAAVARAVVRAITRGRDVVYVPWFWRWIMLIIRLIPERIFKKLTL
ncbi:MAG: SDR family oxidoreductase [Candidatus Rokubacteria bacterium]|nr:SDR family oxidoreductase [Candidatus Rokubacteria bacterium]